MEVLVLLLLLERLMGWMSEMNGMEWWVVDGVVANQKT